MFDLFQVTVRCSGIPLDELSKTAKSVDLDFRKFCPWHRNSRCWVKEAQLMLRAQNDFDAEGEALCEDLRASLQGIASSFGKIEVVAVEPLPDPSLGAAAGADDP